LVDVQVDVALTDGWVHLLRMLGHVRPRELRLGERAPQAGAYQPVQASVDGRAQRPSRSDSSKRDEVPNLLLPPRAKVLQAVKSEARVSEAALVDDQARREPARGDSGHDLIVAQDLGLQVIAPQG